MADPWNFAREGSMLNRLSANVLLKSTIATMAVAVVVMLAMSAWDCWRRLADGVQWPRCRTPSSRRAREICGFRRRRRGHLGGHARYGGRDAAAPSPHRSDRRREKHLFRKRIHRQARQPLQGALGRREAVDDGE